jgi:hypothetical protein
MTTKKTGKGNCNGNGNGNGNGKRRFPSGMTNKRAKAKDKRRPFGLCLSVTARGSAQDDII